MIDYLRGRLVAAAPGRAVLEVGGVGVNIATSVPPDELQPRLGGEFTFYTRLVVREDDLSLYGFRAADERNLFNLVMGVSGFGPRLALALLGAFSASQLYLAVLEENITLLCQAPGVGRKGAQRLVLELKEKLPQSIALEEAGLAASPAGELSPRAEIIEALCALGYTRMEAAAAVNRIAREESELTREELLKLALQKLAGA